MTKATLCRCLPIYLPGVGCLSIAAAICNYDDPTWGWFLAVGFLCTLAGAVMSKENLQLEPCKRDPIRTFFLTIPASILMLVSGRMYVTDVSYWGWFLFVGFLMLAIGFCIELGQDG